MGSCCSGGRKISETNRLGTPDTLRKSKAPGDQKNSTKLGWDSSRKTSDVTSNDMQTNVKANKNNKTSAVSRLATKKNSPGQANTNLQKIEGIGSEAYTEEHANSRTRKSSQPETKVTTYLDEQIPGGLSVKDTSDTTARSDSILNDRRQNKSTGGGTFYMNAKDFKLDQRDDRGVQKSLNLESVAKYSRNVDLESASGSVIDPSVEALKNHLKNMRSERDKLADENEKLRNQVKILSDQGRNIEPEMMRSTQHKPVNADNVHPQVQALQKEVCELRFERDQLLEQNSTLTEQKSRIEQRFRKAEEDLDEVRFRLSRVASNKLTDNNPNIADLSDVNRPTKIADRYMELYTNEWSEAYEELTHAEKRSDRKAVDILLQLIKGVYKLCFDVAEKQENDLKSQISVYTGSEFSPEWSHVLTPFKDKRKKMYRSFLPGIKKAIRDKNLESANKHLLSVDKFINMASELCWLMCIQDPKVHLYTECNEHDKFDVENFVAYTVGGSSVDFLVWPALHLHQKGPVLRKGVAQGRGQDSLKRKSQSVR